MRESRAQTPVMWNKKVSAGFRAENGVPRLYSGARFKVPRPSDTAMGCLSGYSDSRNWPSGLQPVATESATAKQPGRLGESRAPADGKRKRGGWGGNLTRELKLELRQDCWERAKEQERTKREPD